MEKLLNNNRQNKMLVTIHYPQNSRFAWQHVKVLDFPSSLTDSSDYLPWKSFYCNKSLHLDFPQKPYRRCSFKPLLPSTEYQLRQNVFLVFMLTQCCLWSSREKLGVLAFVEGKYWVLTELPGEEIKGWIQEPWALWALRIDALNLH
jgi:hypothetical protein